MVVRDNLDIDGEILAVKDTKDDQYVDFGTNKHVTNNPNLSMMFKKPNLSSIRARGGMGFHNVVGKGHAKFKMYNGVIKKIINVLHVLGFRKNLFFVVVIVNKGHYSSLGVFDSGEEGTKYSSCQRGQKWFK